MNAELDALRSRLEALRLSGSDLGAPVYDSHAGSATPPYFVVSGPPGRDQDDTSLAPDLGHMIPVIVTCTAATAGTVRDMQQAVIDDLTPGRRTGRLTVPARHVQVEFDGMTSPGADTSWKIAGTNSHPMFAVVLLRLHSDPAPIPAEESP